VGPAQVAKMKEACKSVLGLREDEDGEAQCVVAFLR
jgi:hypothetical protein